MPTYRAIQLKGKGGLDQLQEIELPLMAPKKGEIRIRVRASGVGFTDIMKRTGYYPYRPAFPYVEGYEVVGDVDAIGEGITGFALGRRVCALTVYGAWAAVSLRCTEKTNAPSRRTSRSSSSFSRRGGFSRELLRGCRFSRAARLSVFLKREALAARSSYCVHRMSDTVRRGLPQFAPWFAQ
jgi:D-arabinose 1-dehydrogenase-like Zn-dependent alcohol dehydrogenase